jgi:hypothetical protein
VALWQLDGDLLDSGPNGLDLSLLAGDEYYSMMLGSIRGLTNSYSTKTVVGRAAHDEALAITGDMTVMYLGTVTAATPELATFPGVGFGGTGEDEANNFLWSVEGGASSGMKWFSESGSGVDASYNPATIFAGEYHGVVHYAARRLNDVISLFVDGRKIGTSGTLVTPTGGSVAVLKTRPSTGIDNFAIASIRVDNAALSDDEIRRAYNMTIGGWQGWRT